MVFIHPKMFLILLFINIIYAQYRPTNIPYSTQLNCSSDEYFNRLNFRCEKCPNTTIPSSNKLQCICPKNQKFISKSLFIYYCEECPEGTIVSPDNFQCIKCSNGSCNCLEKEILVYQDSTGEILTDGAFCASCSTGFEKSSTGKCDACKDSCSCNNCTSIDQYYTRIKLQNGIEMRSGFIEDRLPIAAKKCEELKDIESCEILANLCVLQNFETAISNACGVLENVKKTFNPWVSNWDPVILSDDSEIDKDNVIDHQYIFDTSSILDIIFARFDSNGTFEGFFSSDHIHLHFCGPNSNAEVNFQFGRRYYRECLIKKELFLDSSVQGKFFEAFLKFFDENGQPKIYPLYVLNSAIRYNDQLVNLPSKDRNRWILTRRFFLVDDYSLKTENSSILYRFAARIGINVMLQKTRDGYIYPPFLTIEYDDSINDILYSTMDVNYFKDPSDYDQKLVIFLSILIPLSLFWAAICAYSWGRRMGKPSAVDASTIIYLLVREMSILGDVFFILFTIIAIWVTFAYKSQTYVFYNMLSDDQQTSMFRYIIIALVLKFVGLIFTMGSLIFQETFFIDWERQKLKQLDDYSHNLSRDISKKVETEPVVVWRTYLIANEWSELKQYRKTSLSIQLILILILHEYFQFKNYALIEPGFERNNLDNLTTRITILSQFAVVVFIYLFILVVQWIVQVVFIERILTDPFHNFIDLCSVSNISILSLTHSLYGYYIHGRSVHGKGDAGMSEMNEYLQRERDNLCGYRGLESSSELQTFTVNLPLQFRSKYDEISQISKQTFSGAGGQDSLTLKMNATVEAHSKMNDFLKKFIDHSILEIDYTIRDRPLLEAVLDSEICDTSITGQFTRDPSEIAYSQCFLYGNEWSWTSFECLLLCVFFIWTSSLEFSCFVVYIVSNGLRLLFVYLSTNHLAKTSLVDQRFLV